jgi:hypothetical protein
MRLSPLVALAALAATSAAGGVAAESIESTCADCSRFVSTMVELSADRFTFAPATSDSDAAAPAGVHAAELARAVGAADVQLCAQLEGEFRNACVHVIETEGSLGPVQVLAATNPDAICAHLTSCFLAEAASVQATTTTVAAPATAFLAEAQGSSGGSVADQQMPLPAMPMFLQEAAAADVVAAARAANGDESTLDNGAEDDAEDESGDGDDDEDEDDDDEDEDEDEESNNSNSDEDDDDEDEDNEGLARGSAALADGAEEEATSLDDAADEASEEARQAPTQRRRRRRRTATATVLRASSHPGQTSHSKKKKTIRRTTKKTTTRRTRRTVHRRKSSTRRSSGSVKRRSTAKKTCNSSCRRRKARKAREQRAREARELKVRERKLKEARKLGMMMTAMSAMNSPILQAGANQGFDDAMDSDDDLNDDGKNSSPSEMMDKLTGNGQGIMMSAMVPLMMAEGGADNMQMALGF